MSENSIISYNNSIVVYFNGYQHPINWGQWYCLHCFEKDYIYIRSENEHLFLTRSYIPLSQFTDSLHRNKINYCANCCTPLYDIDSEQCLLLNPTLNKWLQRFKTNRHYGLRGGGI